MTDDTHCILATLTDSCCLYLLDLLYDGPLAIDELTDGVRRRLHADTAVVEDRLVGLIAAGLVSYDAGEGRYRSDFEAYRQAVDTALDACRALKAAGDQRQVSDWAAAMDAGWNGRRAEPVYRARARAFALSEAGQRHAARVARGTLGVPDAVVEARCGAGEPVVSDGPVAALAAGAVS
ncbi:hypothetical protein ACPEEZ_03625 [Frigoribacterium sp. 2-23]|uniref:hypothetical protein n=1 Tax=Frigoribacterium sp. 2-23 TaxID=3415006 RepID=UPI003C701736